MLHTRHDKTVVHVPQAALWLIFAAHQPFLTAASCPKKDVYTQKRRQKRRHKKQQERQQKSLFLNLSCCCLETGLKPVLFHL